LIRRPTWVLLGVMVLVVGAFFVLKKYPLKTGEPTPTATAVAYLITQAEGNLQSLQITDAQGNRVRMQRDPSGKWILTAPRNGEADQSEAGAAQIQVGALRIIAALDTPPDPSATLLAKPSATIEVTFDTGREHKIEVGGPTPTSSGYYVRLDGSKIYVVSQNGIDALMNLLKSPPYPATPTPAVTDTPSLGAATSTP
jgi:hypothetical protein